MFVLLLITNCNAEIVGADPESTGAPWTEAKLSKTPPALKACRRSEASPASTRYSKAELGLRKVARLRLTNGIEVTCVHPRCRTQPPGALVVLIRGGR